jgi:hypothetical protein
VNGRLSFARLASRCVSQWTRGMYLSVGMASVLVVPETPASAQRAVAAAHDQSDRGYTLAE